MTKDQPCQAFREIHIEIKSKKKKDLFNVFFSFFKVFVETKTQDLKDNG